MTYMVENIASEEQLQHLLLHMLYSPDAITSEYNLMLNKIPNGVGLIEYDTGKFPRILLFSMLMPIGIPIPIPPPIESKTRPLTIATSESTIAIFINLAFFPCI